MVSMVDSAWLDFTKGLGAPIGAVLCGSAAFIGQAWRWKQRLGGSMRQAGVAAAACLHALDHHVERLAEDHANARALARGLAQIEGFAVEEPDTNLVWFDPSGAGIAPEALVAGLAERGIWMGALAGRVRACTHLDVTAGMIEEALAAVREMARR
jgi:threonine aldolase